jgi:hypothetical protein
MPNVIAARSIANEPTSVRLRRTKRSPSAIERASGSRRASGGGSGRITAVVANINAKPIVSAAYTAFTPAAAIANPPSPGPTTAAT